MKFMEIEKMSYIYVENMVLYLQLGIGNLEMELIMRQFQIIRGKYQIKNAVVFSKLCLILKRRYIQLLTFLLTWIPNFINRYMNKRSILVILLRTGC